MADKRILIVEDDADNTNLVRMLLERENYAVISAENGQKGFEVGKAELPDLIILDLDMPIMDGWKTLEQLQNDPATKDIPVVVVTAHLLPDERDRVIDAGGNGYILKPFQANDLIAEIKRCL
jgi:two-component system, cell cycle response regulator DivK